MQISVIIPTYKQKYLELTLSGLSKQTNTNFEVIVVENPIIEFNTKLICDKYNVKLICSTTLGSNRARDLGINESNGEIIALLDDDCVPCPTWIEQIVALSIIYPNFGVFGGPQINNYLIDPPKWIVNDFVAKLSEINWYSEFNGPFQILPNIIDPIHYCPRYLVSGNMFFHKSRYFEVGGLNTKIGYHGNNLISNDEIEFVNKCGQIGNPGIMYSPHLIVRHQIGHERMNLNWFRKRSYGQGWADGDMIRRNNSDKSEIDYYHDHLQYLKHVTTIVKQDNIFNVREKLSDENITREFIKNIIICNTDYLTGYQNGLLGIDLWKSLLS